MKTVKNVKIRTSACQAAASQRIRQIDNQSGSAPPFEQGDETPRWITYPGRHEERRLLLETMNHRIQEAMLEVDRRVQIMNAKHVEEHDANIRSLYRKQAALRV